MANPNILSQRYATAELNDIFSETGKIIAERELWIAVMKAQKRLGLHVSEEAIEKYEAAKAKVDLDLIRSIERRTKHDVKAKIEAFIRAAGAEEQIHMGMTSRDLTDNVEQMLIKRASNLIFGKYVSILRHLVDKARRYEDIILTARTHRQPAQLTLLGRRMSMWAEELLHHLQNFESFMEKLPLRGIKGPVGTQADMLALLGSEERVAELERLVAQQLGFAHICDAPGQIYPRSLDFQLVANLSALACAPENFAKGMRLMSGAELMTEGFEEEQVGSSAMPHKMNTKNSERICGFAELLKMYADGASRLAGDQWEEGDVSCSVLRRVIIPDAFYVSDGLCETMLTILNRMGAYPVNIEREVDTYLPFLATAEMLTMAVEAGIGREEAHNIIRKHAISEALNSRQKGQSPQLVRRLAEDPIFREAGITEQKLSTLLRDKKRFIGNAKSQITAVTQKARSFIGKYEAAADYEPKEIL